jgi:hypothetical protein
VYPCCQLPRDKEGTKSQVQNQEKPADRLTIFKQTEHNKIEKWYANACTKHEPRIKSIKRKEKERKNVIKKKKETNN